MLSIQREVVGMGGYFLDPIFVMEFNMEFDWNVKEEYPFFAVTPGEANPSDG